MSGDWKNRAVFASLPYLSRLIKLYAKTIRWENRGIVEDNPNTIFAVLHGQALIMAMYALGNEVYTMTSRSYDGRLAGRVLELLGYRVFYGSSELGRKSRGGREGAIKLIRVLKEGGSVALTVDGPVGPMFSVQKGVLYLAHKSGRRIIPVVATAGKALFFRSWDRFMIPLPFTKVRLITGDPIAVNSEAEIEEKVKELEGTLRSMYEEFVLS